MTHADLSRRSVAKGAAWAVPAMTAASAAPAMAASAVPTVVGNSYYFDNLINSTQMDGTVSSGSSATCGYYVNNGPATVSTLSITYWLPSANYVFTSTMTSPWSKLTRDASKANRVGPSKGLTYYAYTTTYTGTGDATTTCGPAYSFSAPAVARPATDPGGSYFYQFSYVLNGTAKTNPLQSINNP